MLTVKGSCTLVWMHDLSEVLKEIEECDIEIATMKLNKVHTKKQNIKKNVMRECNFFVFITQPWNRSLNV